MTRLIATTLVLVLVVLVTWALWQRSEAAEARAELAEQRLAESQQRERQSKQAIDALWDNIIQLDAQRQALDQQQTTLERTASNRLEHIKELQHDLAESNAALRDWADTRLPDAIVRLRKRPAVTGADAYDQALRDAQPLHAPGEFTGH